MIRQSAIQNIKPAFRSSITRYRTISTTATRMAEGDTGGVRAGGQAQGDAFSKREQASEDYFVRQKEMEK
ncbi:MAG: hypothetical protein LQ352_006763 [Teloschistes flavicans]|nr:MAG: hypothetical protein LQ352_006763 [Teloschistes flavicans]